MLGRQLGVTIAYNLMDLIYIKLKMYILLFTVFYRIFYIFNSRYTALAAGYYRSEGDAERDISSLGAMG